MPSHSASRILPWSREQLFDLAADVESYPDYVPGWISARIIERTDRHLRVEQRLGWNLLRQPFVSTAELERPERITVHSDDGPFRCLRLEWRFEAVGLQRCRVSLSIDLQLNSSFLEPMVNSLFNLAAADIISRFEIRAHTIYERKAE
jgi:coenzyme Q-binding protein COQ10